MNLLDNAVKYNNQDGSVHAVLTPEGEDKMKLVISDTGIGIPKDKQGRVFERFYRAEESRNKATGGSGLGLAICKHIVEKHQGTLSISSEEGKGTAVTVILPRMSDADVTKEHSKALTAKEEAEEAESGRLARKEAEEDRAAAQEDTSDGIPGGAEKNGHKAKKMKKDKKGKKKSSGHSHADSPDDKKREKSDKKTVKEDKKKK